MSKSIRNELDEILEQFAIDYFKLLQRPDMHTKEIKDRKQVEAKQAILNLIERERVEAMLEGLEMGANEMISLLLDIITKIDKPGTLVRDKVVAQLKGKDESTKDN